VIGRHLRAVPATPEVICLSILEKVVLETVRAKDGANHYFLRGGALAPVAERLVVLRLLEQARTPLVNFTAYRVTESGEQYCRVMGAS
jgi:hypothetical protein